jgi:hypothetical protein
VHSCRLSQYQPSFNSLSETIGTSDDFVQRFHLLHPNFGVVTRSRSHQGGVRRNGIYRACRDGGGSTDLAGRVGMAGIRSFIHWSGEAWSCCF